MVSAGEHNIIYFILSITCTFSMFSFTDEMPMLTNGVTIRGRSSGHLNRKVLLDSLIIV